MNSDVYDALITKLVLAAFATWGGDAIATQSQEQAVAAGICGAVAIGYGWYRHYGMRKVPEKAVVTSLAPTVAAAKAASVVK